MRFKGSSKELIDWFNALISIYGANARLVDIEKSVKAVKGVR